VQGLIQVDHVKIASPSQSEESAPTTYHHRCRRWRQGRLYRRLPLLLLRRQRCLPRSLLRPLRCRLPLLPALHSFLALGRLVSILPALRVRRPLRSAAHRGLISDDARLALRPSALHLRSASFIRSARPFSRLFAFQNRLKRLSTSLCAAFRSVPNLSFRPTLSTASLSRVITGNTAEGTT